MAECDHLIGSQTLEEPAIIGGCVIGVLLFLNVLGQTFSEVFLRPLKTYFIGLVGKEKIEIVNTKTVNLDDFAYSEMAKNIQHAIDTIKGIESGIIHHSRSN